MCWKYEHLYGACFDYLFFHSKEATSEDPILAGSFFQMLQEQYHVEFVEPEKLQALLHIVLENAHEQGWIKPQDLGKEVS